jgi:hypothetical protein
MKQENTLVRWLKMLILAMFKECLSPFVITAALGVEKKPEIQFLAVVKVFLIT